MPPRKKAAAPADASAPATTRQTRSRTKAPASQASVADATAAPSQAKTPKAKGKRTRAVEDDEDDTAASSKKVKADDTADVAKPQDTKDAQDPPAKMVTVIKRGAAPVDPYSGLVYTHAVLTHSDTVWDAALNQTNVGKNANKFYCIQLLHPVGNSNDCILFTRWGRVGENGQQQKKGPFPTLVAIGEFKKQFKAKAGVNWENRHGMVAAKGKYQWLERVYGDDEEEKAEDGPSKSQEEVEKVPDSSLSKELQEFCNLIFSAKLIDAHLSSMNYDANKLPLGKLAKSTILNGFAALKTLSEVISQPDGDAARQLGGFRNAVEELTGRYYSIIPHVFGRNRPTIISDTVLLKKELDLVDALGDMEVASKLISSTINRDENGQIINPLDAHFRSLQLTSMVPILPESKEFRNLEAYARETHGATHSHFGVKIQNAFRVERQSETDAWLNAGFDKLEDGNRLLLWHGSRTTNFAGILKQGLRIAPPEAPVTGYMFGKGVYFADMMSKSANYCHSYLSNGIGLLLLCEVAAKPFLELTQANYDADRACKEAKMLCTKGAGRTQPLNWTDAGQALDNEALRGCHMPHGKPETVDVGGYLQYNEYIVYDPSQIRVRYLLMVKMG